MRVVLFNLALFLLPFALYWVYLQLARRSAADAAAGRRHPWLALLAAGLLLAIGGLVWLGAQDRHGPVEDLYRPHWTIPKKPSPQPRSD